MVDPFTILAVASSALQAVKKGVALYKDIKGTAGQVKEVLDDLDKVFRRKHEDKPASKVEVQQYQEERKRVQEVAKTDPHDVYARVSDQLGDFFDAVDKIEELFWQEEREAKKVYSGDVSLKRRALQRVMISTRIEAMHKEMKEIMVYQTPPELADLWTRFEEMRDQISKEQRIARLEKERQDAQDVWQQELRKKEMQDKVLLLLAIGVVLLEVWGLMWAINLHRVDRLYLLS